ncbi:hypothetical protein GW17_00045428 [Ensete ventricosum]|uniref:Uncharacterized protein n=1 Tax=Ensete ventricosum TaxID=4639 RepID=A0A426YGG5_ENSVE|nr:hypothetical protein B296_00038604 [Ensete ventricosum]RWV92216.1 hypothetical protein GW17_00045428 [Ensete ventricosum]
MWDNKMGRSRGFGFVSFRNQQMSLVAICSLQDAQNAINDMTGKVGLSASVISSTLSITVSCVLVLVLKPFIWQWTSQVSQVELHCQFHILGAGVIEEVRIQRDKGFGFVRYRTHEEAALAIQMANGRIICGKSMKCSWGTKPTPPGTASNPLPPPVPPFQLLSTPGLQNFTAGELLAYQRQLALSQVAAGPMAGQHGLAAQPSAGLMSGGGSQAMYDGYSSLSSAQQLMYYN